MIAFNPMDPEFLADPYPTYHRLRAEDPIHHNPLGFWVLTRYEDVVAVLRDPRFLKEPIVPVLAARFGIVLPPGVGLSMLDRDPPDHTRLRGLVSKAFTPRVVDGLRPRIQQIVDGLLDRVEGAGSMDLIEALAYPLPVNVICEMLGVSVLRGKRRSCRRCRLEHDKSYSGRASCSGRVVARCLGWPHWLDGVWEDRLGTADKGSVGFTRRT